MVDILIFSVLLPPDLNASGFGQLALKVRFFGTNLNAA
jgi:hypothetical protein